jgi:hypothetical protein
VLLSYSLQNNSCVLLDYKKGFVMPDALHTPQVIVLSDGRMDRKNAALYVGLSAKTLAMKACMGTGPKFVKRGRVWYRKEDLDAWLSRGEIASTAQGRLLSVSTQGD